MHHKFTGMNQTSPALREIRLDITRHRPAANVTETPRLIIAPSLAAPISNLHMSNSGDDFQSLSFFEADDSAGTSFEGDGWQTSACSGVLGRNATSLNSLSRGKRRA